jgi:hypothetical protein
MNSIIRPDKAVRENDYSPAQVFGLIWG